LGEFDSIGKIRALAGKAGPSSLLSLGIGDDCCLLDSPGEGTLALSTDTMVEGVHFSTSYFSWRQAAVRAVAAAISDLAAMAARPVCMLAAASVPKASGAQIVDELSGGLLDAASRWSCPLAGGDLTSTAGPVTLTITVVGRCAPGAAITRGGATAGEEIWITDQCGDPSAVIESLEEADADPAPLLESIPEVALDSLFSPVPRLAEAAELLALGPPTAMIDVSDGVAADLGHILEESGVGATLEAKALPAGDYCRGRALKKGLKPWHYCLYGGEDFQLLFTLPSGKIDGSALELDCGATVTQIGRTTATVGELMLQDEHGALSPLPRKGFDHLN
jgi:thiamine-monophosphate kinase